MHNRTVQRCSKAPTWLSGRGRSCLKEMSGLGCLGYVLLSCLFNSFSLSRIGLVPRNAVMVAIDMCRKSLREWIYGVILLFLIIM